MDRQPVWSPEGSCSSVGQGGEPLASGRVSSLTLRTVTSLQNMLAAALYRDDQGGTAVEYGLIAALIAAVIAGAVTAVGSRVLTMFTNLANAF